MKWIADLSPEQSVAKLIFLGFSVLSTLVLLPSAALAGERTLVVAASAYNSVVRQTNDQPRLTAWGDRLVPGMRAIAVSRDLIKMGLGHGVVVRIDGLSGEYVVRDKMAARWKKKIDIYMGDDVQAAKEWGNRKVTIHW